MDPAKHFLHLLQRFEVFGREVIEPAVYPLTYALEAEALQCAEPIPFARAAASAYSPVQIGFAWGPVWSTCWFRVRGRVPASMAGRTVAVRFSTDTEALLWVPTPGSPSGGTPLHGLDVNRDTVRLLEPAAGGENVEVFVEAACNHPFGDRGLQWDPPEVHRRWNSATPGRLDRCEMAVVDETVWRLRWVYTFALQLARELPHDSARAQALFGALRRATNALPDDRVSLAAAGVLAPLEEEVRRHAGGSATLCHAVGHAHIDTAWLWPVRETRRKCMRTFATALRQMERFAEFRFLCSQAQQYAWLEEDSPELFAQVKARIAEGRWEPGGAMWIEPDCNVPGGESLIRQIIHADRYWRDRFGDDRGRQRFLYLPDTFGFPAQLPQIMRLSGLDTFITNKLHWNDTNTFLHTTFIWRGLDGSEVVAHNTPGMDYNALLTPRELLRGERTHKNKDMASIEGPARWLQPFGFGDGGGGPTDWNIVNAGLSADADALPRVRFSTVGEFCEALHGDVAAARQRDASSVPLHSGEIYLELHRGTLTTHARIKQANAECEELLRQAEILNFAGPSRLSIEEDRVTRAELDKAWKLVLLNQFHDILPGSSIGWVYEDAQRDYAVVRQIAGRLIERGMRMWAAHVRPPATGSSACYFNLSNGGIQGFDVVDGRLLAVNGAAPINVRAVDLDAREATSTEVPITGEQLIRRKGLRLESSRFEVEFDRAGRIIEMIAFETGPHRRLRCGLSMSDLSAPGRAINRLSLYEDRPRLWDAWDFDAEHVQKRTDLDDECEHEVIHDTPERVTIRFSRPVGAKTRISQAFTLLAGDTHLMVETEVDWHEEHRLLRVHFPLSDEADSVIAGTQFGERRVLINRNTSVEQAAFEFPFRQALRDPASGLSLAFADRHGASIHERMLGVTLLRSPRYPDPAADVGKHTFRYAIAVDSSFNHSGADGPTVACPARLGPPPSGLPEHFMGWGPLECGMEVAAMKPSETGDRLIVRLINGSSASDRSPILWHFPVAHVEPVDLLERPIDLPGFEHDAARSRTILSVRPFQIVTLAVTRADKPS